MARTWSAMAAVLFVTLSAPRAATAQEIPRPPPEAVPALEAAGPIVWTGCNAPNQLLGTIATVQALVPLDLPANPVDVLALATPVTATFYDSCALFPIPPPLPRCTADAPLAALAMIGAPGPTSVAVVQALAIESAAAKLGIPLGDALSAGLVAGGGCAVAAPVGPGPGGAPPASVTDGAPAASGSSRTVTPAIVPDPLTPLPTAAQALGDVPDAPRLQDAALATDTGVVDVPRRFATWVLSLAILGAAALAVVAGAAARRLRQRISTSSR